MSQAVLMSRAAPARGGRSSSRSTSADLVSVVGRRYSACRARPLVPRLPAIRCQRIIPASFRPGPEQQRFQTKRGLVATRVTSDVPPVEVTDLPPLEAEAVTHELSDSITQLRVACKTRFAFEVEYGLNKGTTDNTYIFKGRNSTNALLGLPDNQLLEPFMGSLPSVVDPGAITHLILPHFTPKRIEALVEIIKRRPANASPLEIYCGNAASVPLRTVLPDELQEGVNYVINTVRHGTSLRLGNKRLIFTLTPTPRWPDLFCTYDADSETLFTAKLFSSHLCGAETFDTAGWETLSQDWKHYFECTLAASARQAKQALQKLQGYQMAGPDSASSRARVVRQLAPSHGVIVKSSAMELIREYGLWTKKQIAAADEAAVAVIYASAYGNTTAMAQAIARGAAKAGVGVESLNCETSGTDEVKRLIKRSSGFVLGSPTLGGHMPTPVQEALGAILQENQARKQPCGVFGSFGWSGEAIDMMHSALKDSGFTFSFDPIRCKFKPTMPMLQVCEESGTDLAQAVLKEKRKKSLQAGVSASAATMASSSTEQAVGRLVGSICVVTTDLGGASSAMLASWVSQASFDPPGITVAVAKERAVEGLMPTNSTFAISVLSEGKTKEAMKKLLKPFKPGEDRFDGFETLTAEKTGHIVLPQAASYLECTVSSKMDAGDHWIVYATVDSGKVLDDNAITAIHHRKVGNHY